MTTYASSNSKWSIHSQNSVLSIGSHNSVLSIGSTNSVLSIGSAFSFASIFSFASTLSIMKTTFNHVHVSVVHAAFTCMAMIKYVYTEVPKT